MKLNVVHTLGYVNAKVWRILTCLWFYKIQQLMGYWWWLGVWIFFIFFHICWASLVAHLVKNMPATWETWVGKIPWRREWLSTPVFWPREFHGLHSPWGRKQSDTTVWLSLHFTSYPINLCSSQSMTIINVYLFTYSKKIINNLVIKAVHLWKTNSQILITTVLKQKFIYYRWCSG